MVKWTIYNSGFCRVLVIRVNLSLRRSFWFLRCFSSLSASLRSSSSLAGQNASKDSPSLKSDKSTHLSSLHAATNHFYLANFVYGNVAKENSFDVKLIKCYLSQQLFAYRTLTLSFSCSMHATNQKKQIRYNLLVAYHDRASFWFNKSSVTLRPWWEGSPWWTTVNVHTFSFAKRHQARVVRKVD